MATTMTDLLVVLLVVISILLLSTGFDHFLTILFTRPSTQQGRDLLTAIEDMVLPMGSFPSSLLNPWSSTPESYTSSPLPPTSNIESKQEAVPALNELTHIQNRLKEIPILSVTQLTTIEIEPSVDATSPAMNDVLAEFHAFENEIRRLVDPKGIQSPQSKPTSALVADMIKNHAEDVNGQKREKENAKEEFERNIQDHRMNYDELEREYGILASEKAREEEKSLQLASQNKYLRIQIDEKIQHKKDAEEKAEEAEHVANAGLQKRIDEVEVYLKQNQKAVEDKLKQERDLVILSKRKMENELEEARSKVNTLEEQQKTAAKENTAILNQYKQGLEQKRLAATTSQQLAELAEQNLQAFRNSKFMEHSVQVASLKKRLRESKDLVKSLEPWKMKAENHERIYQRLRENSTNEADEIREVKDHKIDRLDLDIKSLQSSIVSHEATISRQHSKIANLKSGKDLQELKSKLEQAEKQFKTAELETESLRRDFSTKDAKSKQDAEHALMKITSQHEEDLRTAVDNAFLEGSRKAELNAAEKAAEREREYKQHTSFAVEEAMNNAAVEVTKKEQQYEVNMRAAVDDALKNASMEAAKKEQQYEVAKRAAFDDGNRKAVVEEYEQRIRFATEGAMKNAAEREQQHEVAKKAAVDDALRNAAMEAAKKEQQYEVAKRAAFDDGTRKAVVEMKSKAEAENAAAEAEKQAARETEMDITPDPVRDELTAELDAALKQQETDDAVQRAVRNALDDAEQQHQQKMADEVQRAVQKAEQDAKAKFETEKNPIDLALAATEADEASKLLEEVVKSGVATDTVEHVILRRLTDIKVALRNVRVTLQVPYAPTEASHYQDMLRVLRIEESVLERLENETNHKLLVRQGRLANERLRNVSEILDTSGVQKDEILQALIGPTRQFAPMRGLKRPMQSKKPKVDNNQPSADVPPTPSAQPNADNRESFASILKSVPRS